MKTVAASEAVVILRRQRNVAVVLSTQEYERLTELAEREFRRFCDRAGRRSAAAGMNARRLSGLLREARRD